MTESDAFRALAAKAKTQPVHDHLTELARSLGQSLLDDMDFDYSNPQYEVRTTYHRR